MQLIRPAGDGWEIPAVVIDDAPRFAYHGVMLDVARHFHPVATVTAYIDRASSLKLNHLHLHLTDDQGWRLQLRSRPELTAHAAATSVGGDPGGFYTQDDFREIVTYAAAHHMTVVPEIDLPGHTHAVSLAYPELSEQPVISDHIRDTVRDFGGGMPENGTAYDGMAVGFSSLKIHDEATYAFLADVLGETRRALSPARTCTSAVTRRWGRMPRITTPSSPGSPRWSQGSARLPSRGTRPAPRRGSRPARSASTGATSPPPMAWTRRHAASSAAAAG